MAACLLALPDAIGGGEMDGRWCNEQQRGAHMVAQANGGSRLLRAPQRPLLLLAKAEAEGSDPKLQPRAELISAGSSLHVKDRESPRITIESDRTVSSHIWHSARG